MDRVFSGELFLGHRSDLTRAKYLQRACAGGYPEALARPAGRRRSEVDVILETDDGRVVGIEVKASSSVGARDVKWLSQLRDRLGSRFVAGLVLHTGSTAARFGPRIAAVPLDILWAP